MNDTPLPQKLEQAVLLPPEQQNRLFILISDVFKQALDARSPKNRPPGKAGLRAEKGYYRLLYLEGDFQEKVKFNGQPQSQVPAYDWDAISETLRQLKDIPELQWEITQGIEAALMAVGAKGPG